jgi:hypothetical protein
MRAAISLRLISLLSIGGCESKRLEFNVQSSILKVRNQLNVEPGTLNINNPGQNGGTPTAAAAFSMGTANPTPTKKR